MTVPSSPAHQWSLPPHPGRGGRARDVRLPPQEGLRLRRHGQGGPLALARAPQDGGSGRDRPGPLPRGRSQCHWCHQMCPPLIVSSLQHTSNLATQVMVFREQLSIAIAHKKPICLHVRNADPEAFEVMKSKEVRTYIPIIPREN